MVKPPCDDVACEARRGLYLEVQGQRGREVRTLWSSVRKSITREVTRTKRSTRSKASAAKDTSWDSIGGPPRRS